MFITQLTTDPINTSHKIKFRISRTRPSIFPTSHFGGLRAKFNFAKRIHIWAADPRVKAPRGGKAQLLFPTLLYARESERIKSYVGEELPVHFSAASWKFPVRVSPEYAEYDRKGCRSFKLLHDFEIDIFVYDVKLIW